MESNDDTQSAPSDLTGSTVGRFFIRQRLGAGGMGEVYRADDPQLKRTVAIKRVHQDPLGRAMHRSLLKEAQRASALNHPRIASVYDVFEAGDELFLVMEFIDGMSLRDRIESPLTTDAFHPIAAQCVEGLAAAHARGILHRDLKPANIMLTRSGDVKLCDFGLARRLPTANDYGDSSTTIGLRGPAGTPAYMAPEAVFDDDADARADIFSLGVVFYEMLAGRNPFVAHSALSTIDRVINHEPERVERINGRVSPALASLVQRMIAKEPDMRPSSLVDVGEELAAIRRSEATVAHHRQRVRWIGAMAAAAALIAVVVAVPRPFDAIKQLSQRGAPLPRAIHLAVLPFSAPRGDAAREVFTSGLTETLNTQLSRLTVKRPLQVTTAADLRTRQVTTPAEARQQLGANVALTGSLRVMPQGLAVVIQLVDTNTGRALRTETISGDAADPLAIEARLGDAAIRMLDLDVQPAERAAVLEHETSKPGAYDYYLQARGYLLNYNRPDNVDAAVAVFRKALDIDPRYALAYAGLGQAYWRKHELTGSSAWVEPARGACEGALAIDAQLAEPHACLGMVLAGTGEYEKAAAEYSAALAREPTDDVLYLGLANAYEKLGRAGDAEQAYKRAIELRPQYWGGYNMLAVYYYRLGRFDDALAMFQQVVALTPDSYRGYASIGAVYFMKDDTPRAAAAFEKSLAIRPNYAAASNLGTLYYNEGQYKRSVELFKQAVSFDRSSYQVWANLANALEFGGTKDEATAAFREARDRLRELVATNPRDAGLQIAMADCSAGTGDLTTAKTALQATLKLSPTDPHTLLRIAMFYEEWLHERDAALMWLSQAVARGQTWREIDRSPTLRSLRNDPRFEKLRHQT